MECLGQSAGISVDYGFVVDTDENDLRLEQLHTNVRKYGTISNTLRRRLS